MSLSDVHKAKFFSSKTPVENTFVRHFAGSSDQMYFPIDIQVINIIMKKLLLDPEVKEDTFERAFSMLNAHCGKDESVTHYQVHIKDLKLLKLVIGQVKLGLPFVSPPENFMRVGGVMAWVSKPL